MNGLRRLMVGVVMLLCMLWGMRVVAQPLLPKMTGGADEGLVLLTWQCQYDGIKMIAVKRSVDSNFNYKIIGFVKRLDQGLQAYVDGHPYAGHNYYKLAITFTSGLQWSSDHYHVYVDTPQFLKYQRAYSRNDTLQRYLSQDVIEKAAYAMAQEAEGVTPEQDQAVMQAGAAQVVTNEGDGTATTTAPADNLPGTVVKNGGRPPAGGNAVPEIRAGSNMSAPAYTGTNAVAGAGRVPGNTMPGATPGTVGSQGMNGSGRIAGHMAAPTAGTTTRPGAEPAITKAPVSAAMGVMRRKLSLTVPVNELEDPTFVTMQYVSMDPIIGHVLLTLPPDVKTSRYAIKFFNTQEKMVLEIPEIKRTTIILDRHNFQRRGIYKFVLQKDDIVLEYGYITVDQ